MKKKSTRLDSGAAEKGPLPIDKDNLDGLLAERAIETMTSGDEPAEYNEDDNFSDDALDALGEAGSISDEDEDDFDAPN